MKTHSNRFLVQSLVAKTYLWPVHYIGDDEVVGYVCVEAEDYILDFCKTEER